MLIVIFIVGALCYGVVTKNNANKKNAAVQKVLKNKKIVKKVKKDTEDKIRTFKGANLMYNDKSVPVLMYHSVNNLGAENNAAVVPVDLFKKQMQYLKDNGYTTLSLDELYNFINNNKPVPKKSVVLTFDDGYEDSYTNVYPVLKAMKFRATVFVITALTDKPGPYITSKQIKEMDENGMNIESHTVNHDKLGTIPKDKQYETLVQSKQALEKILKRKVKYIAYPFGSYNQYTADEVKKAGYLMAFTTNAGWAGKSTDILMLNRVFVNPLRNFNQYTERLVNQNYPQ
ncbi:MAG: polysaccharide deacetylase family protein [Clostridium sp.]|nr:polysaccharide deacetylase family protein [Clostridium sp.]